MKETVGPRVFPSSFISSKRKWLCSFLPSKLEACVVPVRTSSSDSALRWNTSVRLQESSGCSPPHYQPNDVHFLFLLPLLGNFSGKRRYRRIVLRLSQSAVLGSAPSSFLRAVVLLICSWCTFPYNNFPNELHTPKHKCLQNHHRQTLYFLGGFFGAGGYSFCMCLRLFLDSKMGVASYLLHTWPITSPVVNPAIDATWQRTFTCTPCFHLLIVPSPQFFFYLKTFTKNYIHTKLMPIMSCPAVQNAYFKKKNQITSTSNNFISANWCLSLCGKRPPHFALHGLKPFAL